MFREVRRQNRILEDEERIKELLLTSEYGFLSLGISENGYSYGIPLNYAYDEEENILYFHCAPEGEKLDILKKHSKVSFCIVGVTQPIPDQFSTKYESVIAFGRADIELSDEEKRKALRLIVKKYSPEYEEIGEKYMDKSWERTMTFKVTIEHLTAKAKY
ncbi:pyridoxamine 5'-phosphate oxidase family protein [Prevotella sp. 10(H)]|uniref:pyridoxamine 5'-phosphate oxidase family protein n=1 Tax=Prevotella sp. 10(H) TaxID=1158294 RepID=UPI0004A6C716|nr:pyridoxamine 5'-phosphate oxidase family protein [Prevotella sp. 10(H)]